MLRAIVDEKKVRQRVASKRCGVVLCCLETIHGVLRSAVKISNFEPLTLRFRLAADRGECALPCRGISSRDVN